MHGFYAAQFQYFNVLYPHISTVDKPLQNGQLTSAWREISVSVKTEIGAGNFDRWFKAVELVGLDDKTLALRAPSNIFQFWIESNYMPILRSATMLAVGGPREVTFVFSGEVDESIAPEEIEPAAEIDEPTLPVAEAPEEPVASNGMNPRNTFKTFVVGANSEYGHAACLAVANAPGKTYNPLFIYGRVGLGKTHLLNAIGHHIGTRKKGGKVLYVSSEHFTNDFIDALKNNSLVKFRKRYRQADVLLIDDIQFFAGKERSQEEFFHTFNALFDGHKQIVLSSDRPPSEIANLEQRLVSRFEWGLTAELQPPDIETRLAILQKKSETLAVKLDAATLQYLADNIRMNVRRLEGALMRVAGFASLNGHAPTRERIEHLLRDILQEEARRAITIEQIQRKVAEHFDVRLADMTSKRRPQNIAFPRQIAMYLARERTRQSLSEIGDQFGGRDHGTVLHAHRLVKNKMLADDKTRQVVSFLDTQLDR